jgi:metal-responsive CopG/Arc/MetJ family transcriptional regulator
MNGKKKRYNLTLNQKLIQTVDHRHDNRSAFVQRAIQRELEREQAEELKEKHTEGYEEHPLDEYEFTPLLEEQEWPS